MMINFNFVGPGGSISLTGRMQGLGWGWEWRLRVQGV